MQPGGAPMVMQGGQMGYQTMPQQMQGGMPMQAGQMGQRPGPPAQMGMNAQQMRYAMGGAPQGMPPRPMGAPAGYAPPPDK